MRARAIGTLLAALVLGTVGGGAAAYVHGSTDDLAGAAHPMSGTPSVPDRPVQQFHVEDDIPYPALTTPTAYDSLRLASGSVVWLYPRPKGWTPPECATGRIVGFIKESQLGSCSEVRFRPFGEPTVGGYSLRVKAIAGDHLTPQGEVSRKLDDLRESVRSGSAAQLKVIRQTDDALYVSILTRTSDTDASGDPLFLRRLDFFHWFTADGSDAATLEMSVAGRTSDEQGLYGLFNVFAMRVTTAG